jgi:hypothetical protein
MTRLMLVAAALPLLLLSACGDDSIPMDKPITQAEPAPQAVPAEPIQRQPLSAPPSSLTGVADPADPAAQTPPTKTPPKK